jgi:thioesterase domain-containing protein
MLALYLALGDARDRYAPPSPGAAGGYAGRVTLLRAEAGDGAAAAPRGAGPRAPTLGWDAWLLPEQLRVVPVLGSHDHLLEPPALACVAAAVADALGQDGAES